MERRKNNHPSGMGRLPALAPLANPYVPYQMDAPERYEAGLGLVRGTLYPGLDLPLHGMINRKPLPPSPMAQLQALHFAITELALYLDTHRDDTEALELYNRYQQMYHDRYKEYTQHHGPLCHNDPAGNTEFTWLNDPWPWEYCANKEG